MSELIINLIASIIITAVSYLIIPAVARLVKRTAFEEKKAFRIALINSIVVGLVWAVITIEMGEQWNALPCLLYFFVAKFILGVGKEEDEEMEYEEQYPSNITEGDIVFYERQYVSNDNKLKPTVQKQHNDEQKRRRKKRITYNTSIVVVSAIFLLLIAGFGYTIIANAEKENDYLVILENKIETLEDENEDLQISNVELRLENEVLISENQEYREKANYLDENIVFVLDGYGNYYYTYDQVQQVTQGRDYSYWVYHVKNAVRQGYEPWE